ncbi:MAG: hypothetical protein K6T99_01815 [Armatimonadetes bacterium]|nr:hypothetical protein [Armatimonadota bacterium]
MGAKLSIRFFCAVLLTAFVMTAVYINVPPFSKPAVAKGVTKTKPNTDSSETSSEEKENKTESSESPKPSPPLPPPVEKKSERRDESRPSEQSNDELYRRNEERRGIPYPSPAQRGPATRDLGSQIQKRSKQRDPLYEFRRHFHDDFFYPYDEHCYRFYPYYDIGAIVITHDYRERKHKPWQQTYEYREPPPGSLEEALVDIQATWREKDPEFLMWHVDTYGEISIYYKGRYSHALTPRQIFKLTAEALDQIDTTEFRFTTVEFHGDEAIARAKHVFVGPDHRTRTAYLAYYLTKTRNRWVIEQIDFRKTDFGAPQCFIATAAYGTPMAKEVVILRKFRDDYLLTNSPGRTIIAAYYKISPPIARFIANHENARTIVRKLLKPFVQACKLAVSDAADK